MEQELKAFLAGTSSACEHEICTLTLTYLDKAAAANKKELVLSGAVLARLVMALAPKGSGAVNAMVTDSTEDGGDPKLVMKRVVQLANVIGDNQ